MKRFHFRKVIGIIIMVFAGILIFSGIVMLLWNALMPVLFHLPVITIWQALGLLLLTKILFSGFRGPGFGGFRGGRGPWKDKMKQQWMNMTPEEREKFKQNWGKRCRMPFDQEGGPFPRGYSSPQGSPSSQEKPFSEKPSSENPSSEKASNPEKPI